MISVNRILWLLISLCCFEISALAVGGKPNAIIKPYKRELLQDLVTWDEHSLFVRGERIFLFAGEFHPFRLPVPGLWLDVFQKIKALGYNGVSFYVDWALLEGKPGHFSAEGVFDFDPFFDAASEAGIYLIARPGPYINAEVSGGGFPAWLQRDPAILRTNETGYLAATETYVSSIGKIVAKAQITNGGPVILLQPENEYTFGADWITFPDYKYFAYVEEQYRKAGIVVPLINNDAAVVGRFAPGTPAAVDIYGHDSYPLGFDCSNPSTWPSGNLPTNLYTLHEQYSPSTPYTIVEFQGGAVDLWGGPGYDMCAALLNEEFVRVAQKNDFSFGVTILGVYMTYGGTNWGNLGQPGGYTSYDYGAAIKEDRTVTREKYSEAKLEANFLQASPAYLTATPGNLTTSEYVSTSALTATPLFGNKTNFYVVRHTTYESTDSTSYTLTVPTSLGNVTLPQLGGTLTLNGRDSKIHVTDYDVGGINLIYSTAEIFTWKKSGSKKVLLLYGGAGETHELALPAKLGKPVVEGSGVKSQVKGSAIVINWSVTPSRRVLHFTDSIDVYLLWRNDAYNYWVLELPASAPIGNYSSQSKSAIVAKAGYLLRTASISGNSLYLTGDLNATTDLDIVAGQPQGSSNVYFNGKRLTNIKSANGRLSASLPYTAPKISLPDLSQLTWKYLDNLPELQSSYDDSAWTSANHLTTNNTYRGPLTTPTSLYADDYGYHTGSLLYRGHFKATGSETTFFVGTQAGNGFAHSIWIGSTFLGSWPGNGVTAAYNQTVTLPKLTKGKTYIITVVIDHMGTETNWTPGYDMLKTPRGILDYTLAGHPQTDVTWKLTGNLGGEDYQDQARGPLNEGGFYAERQGYHQPSPPSSGWKTASPYTGISSEGIAFYSTSFDLNIPTGYDVPLYVSFTNATSGSNGGDFRVEVFVNGYQFGKYINNIGPQTSFPVPEGVLNYSGKNYIALNLWALDTAGAKVSGLKLVTGDIIQSSYSKPALVPAPAWKKRAGAY